MPTDFYRQLGVAKTATPEEIKRAYRKLAGKYHPDRNPGDSTAEQKFKDVNRAHEVLTNPMKRQLYDEFGEVGLREGFNPDMARGFGGSRGRAPFGGGLEDLFGGKANGFGDIFGDVFRSRGPARGADAVAEVYVDFVSAIRGANVSVTVPGAGPVSVRVPAGAGDGDKVRVPGHGGAGSGGGAAGDLLLEIKVRPHPFFTRKQLDLELDLPISVSEAYFGAKVRVPTPHGDVTLKVPQRAKSGQVARLKGKGVARQKQIGDLYVRFLVQLPDADSRDVEKAIETLAAATDLSARDDIKF